MEILTFLIGSGSLAVTVIIVMLFILILLWCILPFAVFGLKGRINQLIAETKRTNELLQALVSQPRLSDSQAPSHPNQPGEQESDPWAPQAQDQTVKSDPEARR